MLDEWRDQVPQLGDGDDELGRNTRFREELRERGERSVLGVPCTTMRDLEALHTSGVAAPRRHNR
jgi:hypothetical protein